MNQNEPELLPPNNQTAENESGTTEFKKELILAKHCLEITKGTPFSPIDHLIQLLRNAYRNGIDLELDYRSLPLDFQTGKVWDALEAIRKKPPTPKAKK